MVDDSEKKALAKVTQGQITVYSNALVQRAVQEITAKSPELIRSVIKRKKILIVGGQESYQQFILAMLEVGEIECDVTFVAPYWQDEVIYSELSRVEYNMVIVTNNFSYSALSIPGLVPEIRKKYPNIKIIVTSTGFDEPNSVAALEAAGMDAFIPLPLRIEPFITKVEELLSK